MSARNIKLVYFAWLRERVGVPEEGITLPADVKTVDDLITHLIARGEHYAYAFEHRDVIRVAMDRKHSKHDAPLAEAREIAFFPPMTGG